MVFHDTGIDKHIKCWRLVDISAKSNTTNGTDIGNNTVGKSTGEDDDNDGDDMNEDEHHVEEMVTSTATTISSTPAVGTKKKKKKKKKKKGNIDGMDPYAYPMKLELHWQFKHHAKINVIAGYCEEEGMVDMKSSYPLFVADTTKDITVYYNT